MAGESAPYLDDPDFEFDDEYATISPVVVDSRGGYALTDVLWPRTAAIGDTVDNPLADVRWVGMVPNPLRDVDQLIVKHIRVEHYTVDTGDELRRCRRSIARVTPAEDASAEERELWDEIAAARALAAELGR